MKMVLARNLRAGDVVKDPYRTDPFIVGSVTVDSWSRKVTGVVNGKPNVFLGYVETPILVLSNVLE